MIFNDNNNNNNNIVIANNNEVNAKIREMNSNEDLVARREKLALAAMKRMNNINNNNSV
jgi:hypothetical protein